LLASARSFHAPPEPEPDTYALLIAGLLPVGTAVTRRLRDD
jgi:hypothetical protein